MALNSGANVHKSYSVDKKKVLEKRFLIEKRKQPGVSFPSAIKQEYILIVRLNLKPSVKANVSRVRKGLKGLCSFFEMIDSGDVRVEVRDESGELALSKHSEFNFSVTLGFGSGFFEKLGLKNRPRRLYEMPAHEDLGDPSPYVLTQTDLIIQICSTKDFVNRWVLKTESYPITRLDENESRYDRDQMFSPKEIHDISTAVKDWAFVTDVHSGFQRLDGRNLMGFMDGTSQPDRLDNNVIWTTKGDEADVLTDGTYMVFQKIEHDLEQWEKLSVTEQEKYVGRSKGTGLLLGTLSEEEDNKLALNCRSKDPAISSASKSRLRKLLEEQRDPYKPLFSTTESKRHNIKLECPIWSHVRKANPRGADGAQAKIIFRRGYLFMEDTIEPGKTFSSGLLFICFQRDIRNGFEHILKYRLNNKNFPVPEVRKNFNRGEINYRRLHGRFTEQELRALSPYQRSVFGLDSSSYAKELLKTKNPDLQNTGKEGLAGPSQLGIYPKGSIMATVTLGGGYYFVPPIPSKTISNLGQQFFD